MKKSSIIINIIIALAIFAVCCAAVYWNARPLMFNPVKIEIELKADQDETCQVFYNYGKGFSGNNSITNKYTSDKYFKRLEFSLPRRAIGQLRIDPGSGSESYLIKRILLQVGDTLIAYSGNEITGHFDFKNLEVADSELDDVLTLYSTENPDAQIIFRHVVSEEFPVINYHIKNILQFSVVFIFLLGAFAIIIWGNRIFRFAKNKYFGDRGFFKKHLSTEHLRYFLHSNRGIIIFSFLVAIFAYGYEVFNFTLSIDEELNSFRTAKSATVYLDVGRWGIYFLNQLLVPESLLPYFPFIMAIGCLAVSAVLFITHFKINFFAQLIFSVIFITHPIHTYYLAFNTSAMYYGIGMVLTVLGFLSFSGAVSNQRTGKKLILLTAILLMFALSFYQSHLAFFLTMGLFSIFYHQYHHPDSPSKKAIADMLWLAAIIVVGFILYQIINLSVKNLVLGSIIGEKSEYLDRMFAWNKMPLIEIMSSLYRGIQGYFINRGYYGGISTQTLIIVLPLVLFYIIKNQSNKNRLFNILILLALVIAPFTIVILNGTPLPVRTLMALPLMIGMLWAFGYDSSGRWVKRLMFIFTIYILLNNTYTNTRLFYAGTVSWQADRNMAVRITERIYNLDLPDAETLPPVVFVGSYQHPSNVLFLRSSIHGASFFHWDHGAHYRIGAFFKTLGINDFDIIKYSDNHALNEKVSQMPSWPEKGSVIYDHNLIIVKLSEPTIKNPKQFNEK